MPVADRAIENIAAIASSAAGSDPLAWGTAHLAERLLSGSLDRPPPPARGQMTRRARPRPMSCSQPGAGRSASSEARRYHSKLAAEAGIVVPDLARMAFIHGTADFLESIAAAFTAAANAGPLERPGELISWNIQLSGGAHPLAERTVSGRSAGLGAYVAFRSLRSRRVRRQRRGLHRPGLPGRPRRSRSRAPATRSKPLITAGSASSSTQRARPGATRKSASGWREWKPARTH